ncbi:acetaldehyde dehydrogenase (acetylating) [Streptomyces sp. NBC_00322]|uniref:acetaldehyde dehydrogenase (acetylating) n=1 Tax=Streptomyces sp. NBC_00322 TaxID=2975712 RepID=UPI002E2B1D8C|nr:acetaldehyde dehydrogenase (acetylating) [Streptomyces sp. NBC_00322]
MTGTNVAVIGSGNIGTDLMVKILRSPHLHLSALVGIDSASEGLARAERLGVRAVSTGVAGLLDQPDFDKIQLVFDATSASAHIANAQALKGTQVKIIDLTPAAIGPYVVPPVNLDQHLDTGNLNMVTCGGQATVPIVAAVSRAARVRYAEIVASIASRSAGPGTRANIDEFTETTSRALETVGGADRGKAIIILNPARPALVMRDTVLCIVDGCDPEQVTAEVDQMVKAVQQYVPGYRLKQDVQFRRLASNAAEHRLLDDAPHDQRWVVSVFLEVEGAGDYLPPFAGNLDIMTSAAVRVAERLGEKAMTT